MSKNKKVSWGIKTAPILTEDFSDWAVKIWRTQKTSPPDFNFL